MMFLTVSFVIAPAPARAQLDVLLEMDAEETETYLSSGRGARGRYTTEQAELIAWRSLGYARPVEVLRTDAYWRDSRFFHVIQIAVRDGSIYRVVVNSLVGRVLRVEVDFLAAKPRLPADLIDSEMARMMAVSTVAERTRGARKPKVIGDIRIIAYKKRLAYEVGVKKSAKSYSVTVDALSGELIDMLPMN